MAYRLLELGFVDRRGGVPAVDSLLDFVESLENPAHGVPASEIKPEAYPVIERLRTLAKQNRAAILTGKGVEIVRPGHVRKSMGDLFSAIGSIVGTIAEVVQKPAFLQAAAVAANFIPKVGTQLSQTLASMYPKAPAATTQAVATSQAIAQAQPQYAGAASQVMGALPSGAQTQANQMAGQIAPSVNQSFIETAMKALGQFTSIGALGAGAGADFGNPQLQALAQSILQNGGSKISSAFGAGNNDLLAAAALSGNEAAVMELIRRGTPSTFPWEYVAIGGGGFLVLLTLILATR